MIVPNKVCKKSAKNMARPDIIEKVITEAQYYYKATQILERERKEELFPPVIMNATFACELFSKAILYKEQEKKMVTGHSLKVLYNKFSDEVKIQIKQCCPNMSKEWLEQFIDDIDEMFEFSRYLFEYHTYSTHYSFVLQYMEILKKVTSSVIEDL